MDVFSEEDANNFIKEFTVFFLLYLNKWRLYTCYTLYKRNQRYEKFGEEEEYFVENDLNQSKINLISKRHSLFFCRTTVRGEKKKERGKNVGETRGNKAYKCANSRGKRSKKSEKNWIENSFFRERRARDFRHLFFNWTHGRTHGEVSSIPYLFRSRLVNDSSNTSHPSIIASIFPLQRWVTGAWIKKRISDECTRHFSPFCRGDLVRFLGLAYFYISTVM